MTASAREQSDALHARVQGFIDQPARNQFDALAIDIARFQVTHCEPLARLYAARGLDPLTLSHADKIPAVPSEAFRLRRFATHDATEDSRCFLTSGTTGGTRGQHALRTTATYQKAALTWARRWLLASGELERMLALLADEHTAPESSLGFMCARFGETLPRPSRWFFDGAHVNLDAFVDACAEPAPLLICGTAFAFLHLLDHGTQPLPLAPNSRVMQTGGFKGRTRSVEAPELRKAIAQLFRLPVAQVIGEYGMTELSSQLYQSSDERYHPPPWLRVTSVSPDDLSPLGVGAPGLARFVDLANVDSSVAVQTADRIVVHEDGSVSLLGRTPGATPRGCSLALEHLVQR